MTNAAIIFNASCKLMEEGILGTTGRKIVLEAPDGTKTEIMEPEPIHTYNAWKAMGYQVKRGERNIAQITIWKPGKAKKTDNEETNADGENDETRMFLKTAFFFKRSQVEQITAH